MIWLTNPWRRMDGQCQFLPEGWGVRLAHSRPCGHLQACYHTLTGRRDAMALHTNIATLTADWPRLTAPGRKRGEGRSSLCVRHGVSVSGCQQLFSSSSPQTLRIRTCSHTQTSVTLPDTGHCTLALKMAAVALDILNAVCPCHYWWVELKGL